MSPLTNLADEVAPALQASVRLLVQRLRQSPAVEDDVTSSETSVLSRLHRDGPNTAAELARLERITPQSMGSTVAALEGRGLVTRHPDPDDGRRIVVSVTRQGNELLRRRRRARSERLSLALQAEFDEDELRQLQAAAPLIERIAHRI
jgi:DNA-binding MarR family transcriptional regulator